MNNSNIIAAVKSAVRILVKKGDYPLEERLILCEKLLARDRSLLEEIGWDGSELESDYDYYKISALYMLLMPDSRRRKLSAYFTPPYICEYIIKRLSEYGVSFSSARVLDPACGGAAFLLPVIEKIFYDLQKSGAEKEDIAKVISNSVVGVEINPGLATLCRLLVADLIARRVGISIDALANIVIRGDALRISNLGLFDIVISNPPYGRVFRYSTKILSRWGKIVTNGYVNTYAIFVCHSLEGLRKGGIAALVIPTSFISGPNFFNLREYILSEAHVLGITIVDGRSKVFIDVVQDTCVLFLRKRGDKREEIISGTECFMIGCGNDIVPLGVVDVPEKGGRAWVLPSLVDASDDIFSGEYDTFSDYGYRVVSGYFVWNRSKDKMFSRSWPREGEYPLIWASNVRNGEDIKFSSRILGEPDNLISFVAMDDKSVAIQKNSCIVIQRTTNRRQVRRIIAGVILQRDIDQYGGFVSENHTILIAPVNEEKARVPMDVLRKLISSNVFDERYRRFSGTTNVSTKLLRSIPLPKWEKLLLCIENQSDIEIAIRDAYSKID